MLNKKLVFIVAFLVFALSGYTSYSYFADSGQEMTSPLSKYQAPKGNGESETEEESNEPKTEECPINGEMLTKTQKAKWEKRRPLGVMIENHKDARPQSGLSAADVVYEAVAEGGITRFMAVYYCKDAPYVGPVRSARIYFIRLLQEYGSYPLYAHVGGANCDKETGSGCDNGAPADAIGIMRKMGWEIYNDLNQFGVPFPYYWRDPERLPDRATEHTVYSSTSKLWQYVASKRELTAVDEEGERWDTIFSPWEFKDDAKASERGTVAKISFGFWDSFASDFAVSWVYDKETNGYARINGGKPHVDKNTGKQLKTKNVVVIFADESSANDGYPGGHILYDLTGSGDGYMFQDGKAVEITWKKEDFEERMRFYDPAGEEVPVVRGKVFVEILPVGNDVTF
jgi:hypothetical protein